MSVACGGVIVSGEVRRATGQRPHTLGGARWWRNVTMGNYRHAVGRLIACAGRALESAVAAAEA